MNVSSMDRYGFYHWMQRELESDLKQFYKKIHSIKVLDDEFCIWFINNEDCVCIDSIKYYEKYICEWKINRRTCCFN